MLYEEADNWLYCLLCDSYFNAWTGEEIVFEEVVIK
jgi:hypothetical protein